MLRRRLLGLCLAFAAVAIAGLGLDGAEAGHEEALANTNCPEHPPIAITEDVGEQGFVLGPEVGPLTAPTYRIGSGVVAGSGTAVNPYVIEEWCISSDPQAWPTDTPDRDVAISIQDTSAHVVVRDNVVASEGNFASGVEIRNAEHVRIVANDVADHAHDGVRVDGSEDVDVHANRLAGNGDLGVRVDGGLTVSTTGNTIVANDEGAVRVTGTANAAVEANDIADNGDGIAFVDADTPAVDDNTIQSNGGTGIALTRSDEGAIRGNEIDRSGLPDAIRLFDTDQTTIADNTITRTINGIGLWVASDDNTIRSNTVRSTSGDGVTVSFSANTVVEANTIEDNAAHGLRLAGTGSLVEANTILGNDAGIDVGQASTGATIEANELASNRVGVAIEASPTDGLHRNVIENNAEAGLAVTDVAEPVLAQENGWGHPSGPSGGITDACTGAVADGDGQAIATSSADVCFDPWLETG
jgi:parallel beta-helix repeat protein